LRSYKDLPLILYQVQTKFRDEVRPRFGIVRSCEFIMKDAYSFDVDAENMEKSYKAMYDAYCRIFERCGLPYIAVEADPGLMGGTVSHEFMVPSAIGEDRIIICASCGYAASTEVAKAVSQTVKNTSVTIDPIEEVDTPDLNTVKEVSDFLKVRPSEIIKTLIYSADDREVAVLIRGDHEASETKIKKSLVCRKLELASEKRVKELTLCSSGFLGPVGLDMEIIADHSIRALAGTVTGANKKDKHMRNVALDRDFKVDKWIDARVITAEDPCPKCGGKIDLKYAIEIGHTFKLGTKYSEPLNVKFLDQSGKERPVVMGCYGIGVNRILASLVETSYDANGIVWPMSLCPAEAVIIPIKFEDENIRKEAERVYEGLKGAGLDVILDDRDKSAGIKFKDADLLGFPFKVIIGNKGLEQGKIEVKDRKNGESVMVTRDSVIEYVKGEISSRLSLCLRKADTEKK
jgi:prolyl-tRNA synthetase